MSVGELVLRAWEELVYRHIVTRRGQRVLRQGLRVRELALALALVSLEERGVPEPVLQVQAGVPVRLQ
jgi:hypothetical protein